MHVHLPPILKIIQRSLLNSHQFALSSQWCVDVWEMIERRLKFNKCNECNLRWAAWKFFRCIARFNTLNLGRFCKYSHVSVNKGKICLSLRKHHSCLSLWLSTVHICMCHGFTRLIFQLHHNIIVHVVNCKPKHFTTHDHNKKKMYGK